jgi:hypothetical protein
LHPKQAGVAGRLNSVSVVAIYRRSCHQAQDCARMGLAEKLMPLAAGQALMFDCAHHTADLSLLLTLVHFVTGARIKHFTGALPISVPIYCSLYIHAAIQCTQRFACAGNMKRAAAGVSGEQWSKCMQMCKCCNSSCTCWLHTGTCCLSAARRDQVPSTAYDRHSDFTLFPPPASRQPSSVSVAKCAALLHVPSTLARC